MASSMVTSFLGSVEVVVKEDWDELSEKASVRPQPRPTAEQDTHNMTSAQPGNDVTQPTNDAEERLYTMEEPGNGAMQSLCFTPLTSLAHIGDCNYLKGKVSQSAVR